MEEKQPACCSTHYHVSEKDLPLCCPRPNQRLWDAHPRVYLPIVEAGGRVVCPYCDAKYTLISSAAA